MKNYKIDINMVNGLRHTLQPVDLDEGRELMEELAGGKNVTIEADNKGPKVLLIISSNVASVTLEPLND